MYSPFEELCEIADTNLNDLIGVKKNAVRMEKMVLALSSEDDCLIVERLKKIGKLIKLQILYETYKTELETDSAMEFLEGEKTLEALMSKRSKTLITNEISIGKIRANDKILFIGSGPLPMSAILYNKYAACPVDCYEKDKNKANLSKKVLSKLGLLGKINVYCKSGEKLKTDKYNVIVVALLAKPKNKIFRAIYASMKPGTRVICRTSDAANKILYEETDEKLFKKYGFSKKNKADKNQTVSSVFYLGN
ncbi:MAG: nicotianamine synthase family protein [Candidatus Shapirobacteria bacterium]|jgi:hypothetical protein